MTDMQKILFMSQSKHILPEGYLYRVDTIYLKEIEGRKLFLKRKINILPSM